MPSTKLQFLNNKGLNLSAKLEIPANGEIHAYAILAHVFTGNKNLSATRYIARCLVQNGIAVLRFDFTGLGESEGLFEDTNFSSNVDDILSAAQYLEDNYEAPELLVGHSLGGAAVIYAGSQLESIKAIATIGAPSEPEHVTHLLSQKIETIKSDGKAMVDIGGRQFTIKKQFLDDLRSKNMEGILKELKKPILVMHSPQDSVVGIENAAKIYHAAFHPKSFISLDGADHMLSDKKDAHYVGDLVASWLSRYISSIEQIPIQTDRQVAARLGDVGYTTEIKAGKHSLLADESESINSEDFGPSPYQLLSSSLAACKVMTLQMYARRKQWELTEAIVHVDFRRNYTVDCEDCESGTKKIDLLDCTVELIGDLDETQRLRLLEIADRCPVHKTLSPTITIQSVLKATE